MGARTERLGHEARQAARRARWRRFLANGVANQPDASVIDGLRADTDLEVELRALETQRTKLEGELSSLHVDQDDRGLADQLRRDIEQLEGVIARERKQTKKD